MARGMVGVWGRATNKVAPNSPRLMVKAKTAPTTSARPRIGKSTVCHTFKGPAPSTAAASFSLGRALVVGAVFAFTISIGEFGATLFVARPQTPTMPLAIYRFLGQPGAANYGQAMAMSSILMLVSAAGFMLMEKFRVTQDGEF